MSDVSSAEPSSLSTILKTGRALFLLQLLSRLVTFALNQSLVRLAPPEVFGTASIQFDLIASTILFLSREGVRNALIRKSDTTQSKVDETAADGKEATAAPTQKPATPAQTSSLASVSFFLGILVSGLVTAIYLYSSSTTTTAQSDFHLSLALYVLASLVELSVEPLYISALTANPPKLNVRVSAEGGMAIVKALVTCAWLVVKPRQALLGFALGQISGAIWLAGRYIYSFGGIALRLPWSKGMDSPPLFDPSARSLAIANTRQSVIKHLLTEADRIAVSRICPLQDQGGYAVAMNYGSLIARIIFQPLEETLMLHFSKNQPATSPSSAKLLGFTLHIASHLLFILPSFLPPLYPPILPLMLPRKYLSTSTPYILQRYLEWYIPLLSLNGILEAFHTATATPKQVARQATWMIISSLGFASSLYALTGTEKGKQISTMFISGGRAINEQTLIAASCISMLIRIIYAFVHAKRVLGNAITIRDMVPRSISTIVILLCGSVLRRVYMQRRWMTTEGWIQLVGLGGALGIMTLCIMWRVERQSSRDLLALMKDKKE